MLANDTASIQKAAEQRLSELGETGDVQAVAAAITKQTTGEKLSKAESKLISNSVYGKLVANELNPQNIQSGDFSTEWAQSIGTDRINPDAYSTPDMTICTTP